MAQSSTGNLRQREMDDHLPGPTSDKRLSCDMLTQFFLNCKRSKTIQANIKLHYSTSKCMPFTLAGNL